MAVHKGVGRIAIVAVTALALTACSGSSGSGGGSSDTGAPKGDISFLTNRTDLQQDGTFDKYVKEFQKTYPDVNVKVEGITNYADDVRTRMSTPNGYGDVLMIPATVPADQFGNFFEPLGKVSDLAKTYRFQAPASYDGTEYGIALGGNANGVLYNTDVWKKAGITTLPATPDEFLADLKLIKEKTSSTPYYTNYKDGWPLGGQWFSNVGALSGDVQAQNAMTTDQAPWTQGKDVYAIDSVLYDVVKNGLNEKDPLTTNWEQSKADFGTGKIATMVLGSWAISQFQAAAKDAGADPSIVGFMPWPATAPDGKRYATMGGDYNLAVNKNSPNKEAAKAWMMWLLEKSGFTDSQGMISAIKTDPLPANLSGLKDAGIELIEPAAAPKGQEGLLNTIADKSKVDVWGNLYRQKLVDLARGQAQGDKSSFFADLNTKWAEGIQKAG